MLFLYNRYANQEGENNILPHACFVKAVLIHMIVYTGYAISKKVQKIHLHEYAFSYVINGKQLNFSQNSPLIISLFFLWE